MEQWEQIKAVQNMQDYIQQHLYEPITLTELARNAGYSPFHSARLFKEHIGKAPFEYIRTMRLTQAALKLRDEKVKVLDVAMNFVFDSHEGFTRAFSKEFGITPYKYSKNPPPIQLFMPTPIRDQYLFYQRGGVSRVTGGKTAASRTIQLLGAILEFAKRRGLIDNNPAHGIQKPKSNKIPSTLLIFCLARVSFILTKLV